MDFAEDMAHHLAILGMGAYGVDIRTIADYDATGRLEGILVENTAAGTAPDITTGMDEALVDITVSKGYGQRGRDATASLAYSIYRALAIEHDVTVDGTLYRCISADTPPYEMWQDDGRGVRRYYQVMRVRMTRYYEGIKT